MPVDPEDASAPSQAPATPTIQLERFSPGAKGTLVAAQQLADKEHHAEVTLLHLLAAILPSQATRNSADKLGGQVDDALKRLAPVLGDLPRSDEQAFLGREVLTFLARVERAAPDDHTITFPELLRALASYGHDDPGGDERQLFRRIVVGARLDRLALRAPQWLPVQPILDTLGDDDRAALTAVLRAIDDEASILRIWQEKKIFVNKGDVGIEIVLGPGASPAVAEAAQRYEASADQPFSPLLRAFLSIFDGMEVRGIPDAHVVIAEMPHPDVTNGILFARFVEPGSSADEVYDGLVFGRVYGQYPLLLVDEGEHAGKIVFDDFENPEIIANSLPDFLRDLVAHGLSAEAVIHERT